MLKVVMVGKLPSLPNYKPTHPLPASKFSLYLVNVAVLGQLLGFSQG